MQVKELDEIKIFFILGRPRSGTTLLRTLFDAHTNVSIPYEGRIIMDLYFKYGKLNNWNEKKLTEFYNDAISINKLEDWEFNDNLKEQILSLGNDADFTRLIKLLYINFKSLFNKENIILIGDKNPYYSIRKSYLKIIKKTFPDAKIIHLVRDYRAHYYSMTKMDFENNSLGMVAYRWKYSYKIIKQEFANTNNYLFVKHEDITSEPQKTLEQICIFLCIEYQESMLKFYKIKDIALEKYGKNILKVHSSLLNPVTGKCNNKWKNKLSPKEINYLEKAIGDISNKMDYKRTTNKTKSLWFYHLYNKLYFIYAITLDYLPIKTKQKIIKMHGFQKIFL